MKLEPAPWGLSAWRDPESDLVFEFSTRDVPNGSKRFNCLMGRKTICSVLLNELGETDEAGGKYFTYSGTLIDLEKSFIHYTNIFLSEAEKMQIGTFSDLLPIIIDGLQSALSARLGASKLKSELSWNKGRSIGLWLALRS